VRDQLGNADDQVVPTIACVDSEGYGGTPLRLRGNVIARLIRPQPERASLVCPAVEPNTRAGLFLCRPSEASQDGTPESMPIIEPNALRLVVWITLRSSLGIAGDHRLSFAHRLNATTPVAKR
jgi:hypothetical protein